MAAAATGENREEGGQEYNNKNRKSEHDKKGCWYQIIATWIVKGCVGVSIIYVSADISGIQTTSELAWCSR